jgi:hypothetical protein
VSVHRLSPTLTHRTRGSSSAARTPCINLFLYRSGTGLRKLCLSDSRHCSKICQPGPLVAAKPMALAELRLPLIMSRGDTLGLCSVALSPRLVVGPTRARAISSNQRAQHRSPGDIPVPLQARSH